jgi:hypothetical protein
VARVRHCKAHNGSKLQRKAAGDLRRLCAHRNTPLWLCRLKFFPVRSRPFDISRRFENPELLRYLGISGSSRCEAISA